MTGILTEQQQLCSHCGSICPSPPLFAAEKPFCCEGCRAVYLLLQDSLRCAPSEGSPQLSTQRPDETPYRYLNHPETLRALCDYLDEKKALVTLPLPAIHCPSCIWILEQLPRLADGIISARVNYLKKEVQVQFNPSAIALSQICALLASMGYEPELHLDAVEARRQSDDNRRLLLKLGLAGFAFGNIMLFSLPEYFDNNLDRHFKLLFTGLNIALSMPVLFYSASEFFQSAWQALRRGGVNMDVPITLGILAMFARSIWELATGRGPGYMDTFNGLIFLLLIGRWFQRRTHEALSFTRDYRSFFPLAITRQRPDGQEELIAIRDLKEGDVVRLRHGELLPADAILLSEEALLDYSFVTGENEPVRRRRDEIATAGGRVVAHAALFRLNTTVNHSRLTRLWNHETLQKKEENFDLAALSVKLSPWFTLTILVIATSAALWWGKYDWWQAFNAVTGVLIIACPCALAMSAPFSLGNALNIFSLNGLYLKNPGVIEKMARIKNIVFDKTGTITELKEYQIEYAGSELSIEDRSALKSLFSQSVHPLSRALATSEYLYNAPATAIVSFKEETGLGLLGNTRTHHYLAGAEALLQSHAIPTAALLPDNGASRVYLAKDGQFLGVFLLQARLRSGITRAIQQLAGSFRLFLLSGDNEREKHRLLAVFPESNTMYFRQTPEDKLEKVELIGKSGSVLMVGDGLNDAGALKAAEVGLAVADDSAAFTPASDGILAAESLKHLPEFLSYARDVKKSILVNFGISFAYNIFGLTYAVQGLISPLFCAILMPISSITVITTATLLTRYYAWRRGLVVWK